MTRKSLLALVCSMVLVASTAWVAPAWAATVSGMVTDAEGQAVVGAQVTFRDEEEPTSVFSDVTDDYGKYDVRLAETAVEERDRREALPEGFTLLQNYPNPFNPSTVIPYTLAKRTDLDLSIYNILGQRVRTLVQGVQDAGVYAATWDGRDDRGGGLAAGVYLCVLRGPGFVEVRKMVMMDGAAGEPATRVPRRRALKRSAGPDAARLYTVKVSESILPFVQRHIPISGDAVLDFVVDIYVQVQGTVSLPAESPVTPSELEVVSFVESSPVETSGEYAAEVVKTEKPQVVAYVKDGKPILLGYLFPKGTVFPLGKAAGEGAFPLRKAVIGTAEGTVADARTTALALAMMSPLLVFSSGEQRTELAQAVVNQPEFLDLVAHIEEVLRTEPEKVLDGEAHPEIYTQAAQVLLAAIERLGPQGKPSLVQGKELPWVEDRTGSKLALINPQNIYYGTGIYGYETGDKLDVFLLPPKDGIVDFHWGLNFITWAEDTETEKELADGEYTFTIYKGIVNDFPIGDLISWSHPAGRATIANVGTAFLDVLDIIIGIKVHPEFSGLHLDIGGIAGLTEHMLAGDVVAVLRDAGSLLLTNLDDIGLWLWEGAVKDSQRQLLNTLMPIFRNVTWPLKVLNVVTKIPFYYDLVTAPGEARYSYAIEEGKVGPVGDTATFPLPGAATMEMVWIEPGTFTMGSPSSEPDRDDDEGPQHDVTITKGFWLGKYELTQGQWQSVMGTTPWSGQSYVQEDPDNAAPYISWDDVQAFVAELNADAGSNVYRLPTEAEWEYSCRAGTTPRWSFGDDESQLKDYAWYGDNAWDVGEQYAHAVGTKLPNPWRLYDLYGNVLEWVQDWYGSYSGSSQTDPTGPALGSARVVRGGSFGDLARVVRSADRSSGSPGRRYYHFGARLVRQGQ